MMPWPNTRTTAMCWPLWCWKLHRKNWSWCGPMGKRLKSPAKASNPLSRVWPPKRRRRSRLFRVRSSASSRRALPGRPRSCLKWKGPLLLWTPIPGPFGPWWGALTLRKTNSTTSPKLGASPARRSSRLSTLLRWRKALFLPPSSMTLLWCMARG